MAPSNSRALVLYTHSIRRSSQYHGYTHPFPGAPQRKDKPLPERRKKPQLAMLSHWGDTHSPELHVVLLIQRKVPATLQPVSSCGYLPHASPEFSCGYPLTGVPCHAAGLLPLEFLLPALLHCH